ncbi:von Willebrand factor A domain-containing protein 5A-like [Polypterus senegalus]|uniref:von Willebrand factor A domain-containing protein 5A-like n=1 Tax=Polypterus senegalus TaxID=55291 RepID=UPI0019629423|nr:von Willebrand factor A domain-containing protein 5A-like [Polypterus senegalus]
MRCGLLTQKKEPVPLKSIAVEISISGFIADVSSTLSYENTESNPVEAVFVFPMEDGSSVYDFHAEIGGKRIEAVIKEKQEARDDYDDAISSGQEAFLLEESDESPDVFSLSVGSLPAGQTASVSLSYVTELPVQADDALRFCLPTVLCPRYTPQGMKDRQKVNQDMHLKSGETFDVNKLYCLELNGRLGGIPKAGGCTLFKRGSG